jgi:hypothetical protein
VGADAVRSWEDHDRRTATAGTFAHSWLEAWNAHDLEATILSHFSDDAVFSSPVAAQTMPQTGGVLNAKNAIRADWIAGLERSPDVSIQGRV